MGEDVRQEAEALRAHTERLERIVAEQAEELEAARREAEIEAALERVRSRTMAMNHSDELREVIAIVYEQFQSLGCDDWGYALVTREDDTGNAWHIWMSLTEELALPEAIRVPYFDDPIQQGFFKAWELENSYQIYEFGGPEKRELDQRYFTETAWRDVPEAIKNSMRAVEHVVCCMAVMRHSVLEVMGPRPIPDDKAIILRRFAQVFEQTYTRFLDLKKAEEQAREAQIEAALERVRARTMAMHRSDELGEAASVAFQQLKALGVVTEADRFSFGIFDIANGEHTLWITEPGGTAITRHFTLPIDTEHGPFAANYEAWLKTPQDERKELVFVDKFSGQSLADYLTFIVEYTDLVDDETVQRLRKAPAATRRFAHTAAFSHGGLHVLGPHGLETDTLEILKRFARVFEQTYVRFLDLQKAEARAREATRQAAIDRLCAEIASMRTANDLQRITPLVWRELTTLGVPFFRCGVFIINEAAEAVQVFLTNPEGKALAALDLGFNDAPLVTATVAHWRQGAVYTEEWDADDMQAWTAFLQERGLITQPTKYFDAEAPPEQMALHFVPFAQGMLYVGSAAPLDDEAIDAAQALADAFAVAYARYEDFQRLEAKNREVERAMAELKAAQQQLIHAEKMASLGALTAGIAHEIKNPLNFVNNFSELAVELADELDEEVEANLDARLGDVAGEFRILLDDLRLNASKIREHGQRADGIVRAMMQHARGGGDEREVIDLNALVAEYVDLAYHGKRAQTPDFNVEIREELDEAVGRVDVVPQEIGRVLLNLVGNAFDAVYEQQKRLDEAYAPRVTVSTRRTGDQVEIRVEDNGPGIPEDVRGKIFEPFFTTKPTGQGTGLGLSLSYDIITQGHGGTLTAQSEDGHGAAFVVTLPNAIPQPSKHSD